MQSKFIEKWLESMRQKIKLYADHIDNILFWNEHAQLRKFFKGEKAYFIFKKKKYFIWIDKTIKYKYEK
jgi:hypothetical protein